MTDKERDDVILECVHAARSLMKDAEGYTEDEREHADIITGAVCYRLLMLQSIHRDKVTE